MPLLNRRSPHRHFTLILSLALLIGLQGCFLSDTARAEHNPNISGPASAGNAALSATPVNVKTWSFYVQPWSGVKFTLNGEPVKPRLRRKDKTQGLMRLHYNFAKLKQPFTLTAQKKGFHPLTVKVDLAKELKRAREQKLPPLFQLMPVHSKPRLVSYWSVGKWPKSVTFIDNRRVSVPLLNQEGIHIVDIFTGQKTFIAPPKSYAKATGFVESLVLPDKNELWVSQMSKSAIHIFTNDTLQYQTTIKLKGNWSKVLLRDTKRNLVYCSNWSSHDISVVDITKRKELYRINVGGVPRGMVLSDDNKYMYVAQFLVQNKSRGRVVKVDLASRRIVKRMGKPGAKRHIVKDKRGYLYVSDMSKKSVDIYNTKTDRLVKTIPVYHKPNTVVLSPDQQRLYISNRGPNNPAGYTKFGLVMGRLYVIDTAKQEVSDYWEGGNQPTGLDISPDGKLLVSSDFLDNRLRVYRLAP